MDVPLDELEVPSSLARRKNHPNQLLAPLSGREAPAPEDNLGEGLLQANDRRRWRVLSQTDEYLSAFTPRAAYPNQLTPVEVSLAAGDDFDSDHLQPSVHRRISSPLDEGNFSFTRSGDYPNRLTVSEESIVLEDDPDTDQLESNAGGKPASWHSTNTPDSPLLGGTDERLHQSRLFEVRNRGPAVNLLRLLFLLVTVLSYWFYLLLS
ncbi:hypothetical protein BDZ97DRAFT_1424759 [Flammula alnicola]|nr:hypothetical protein BDZ97DRAFT_1424759 [Flammula alnicola]